MGLYNAIVTRYHPAGNVRPARMSAIARGHPRVYSPYDHGQSAQANHRAAADAFIRRQLVWDDDYNLHDGTLPGNPISVAWVRE